MTDGEVEGIIRVADTDGDGLINSQDFTEVIALCLSPRSELSYHPITVYRFFGGVNHV